MFWGIRTGHLAIFGRGIMTIYAGLQTVLAGAIAFAHGFTTLVQNEFHVAFAHFLNRFNAQGSVVKIFLCFRYDG